MIYRSDTDALHDKNHITTKLTDFEGKSSDDICCR